MLSPKAEQLIHDYFHLPFPGVTGVRCPYFNNVRSHRRAQLRALIGKGLPQEIVDEAKIVSIQYGAGVFDHQGHCCLCDEHASECPGSITIRHFLIDHNLGVDCSGFINHVLRAHFKETKGIDLAKKFVANIDASWPRKLIMRLRPIENLGVRSALANDKNTEKIGDEKTGYDFSKIRPADLVIMLETGPQNKRSHVLLITDCDGQTIKYVHSRAWSGEGQYGHGVNGGEIRITKPSGGLLEQEWEEKIPPQQENLFDIGVLPQNETLLEAKQAKILEIRRVKI